MTLVHDVVTLVHEFGARANTKSATPTSNTFPSGYFSAAFRLLPSSHRTDMRGLGLFESLKVTEAQEGPASDCRGAFEC